MSPIFDPTRFGLQVSPWRGPALAMGAVAALLIAAFVGVTSSQASSPHRGGNLRVAFQAPVTTLDQFQGNAEEGIWADEQITQPLVEFASDGKVVPLVASHYTVSANAKVWTFRLRPGIKFSNGTPVRPADVVFTLESSKKGADWGFLLADVQSITASGSDSVTIRTKQPTPSLPAALALFANGIVPDHFDGKSKAAFWRSPIGTGPFEVKTFQPGASLTLQRNPHYWQSGLPYLDTVQITGVADTNSRVSQLQGDSEDVISSPNWSQVKALKSGSSARVVTSALARVDYFFLNAKAVGLTDKNVREAFSLALNRAVIARATLDGFGAPAGSFLAPSVPGVADRQAAPAQDLSKARQLLKDSSYHGQTITITYNGGDTMSTELVQIAQQELSSIGLKTKLEGLDYSTLVSDQGAGHYEAAMAYSTSDILDPSELVGFFVNGNGFSTYVHSDALVSEAAKAGATVSASARAALYGRVVKGIDDEYGLLPVQYEPYVYATSAHVTGFTVAATGALSLDTTQVNGS